MATRSVIPFKIHFDADAVIHAVVFAVVRFGGDSFPIDFAGFGSSAKIISTRAHWLGAMPSRARPDTS